MSSENLQSSNFFRSESVSVVDSALAVSAGWVCFGWIFDFLADSFNWGKTLFGVVSLAFLSLVFVLGVDSKRFLIFVFRFLVVALCAVAMTFLLHVLAYVIYQKPVDVLWLFPGVFDDGVRAFENSFFWVCFLYLSFKYLLFVKVSLQNLHFSLGKILFCTGAGAAGVWVFLFFIEVNRSYWGGYAALLAYFDLFTVVMVLAIKGVIQPRRAGS